MVALLSVFAEFEREILRERVPAGLAHARQNGKCLGRPATAELHADKVRKLRRSGLSKSESARRLNIGRTSVRRILATPPEKKSSGLFNYAALPKTHDATSDTAVDLVGVRADRFRGSPLASSGPWQNGQGLKRPHSPRY
jgi:DNA invertase Pin-like site-specific DNA recombinase